MDEPKPMRELTRIREERGLSQQGLADASGVNKATINQIERGRRSPNLETLQKLADALAVEMGDFFPKAQASLPLDGPVGGAGAAAPRPPTSPAGWQTLANYRRELLEEAAKLWDRQLERGQYDWQTLKAMESVGFRLALNHTLEARAMKQWLNSDQLAQLEHAEKRYGAHARKIVGLLRRVAEEEKKKLSEAEVVYLERDISQREAALQQLKLTG